MRPLETVITDVGLRITSYIFLGISLIIATTSYAAEAYIVSYVYDGDTVKLHPINSNEPDDKVSDFDTSHDFKLRLTDIDAPERNQAYGLKSRSALIKLCQGNNILVTAQIIAKDKYLRSLGRLQCNHIDASLYLAEQGLAWHYANYSSNIDVYNAALKARQQRLGLWADDNPIPPWDWRHGHFH
jgi:endonuclease YncB( thermonuclease family)